MKTAAKVYAGLFAVVALFQCAVILGAPFGAITQGGLYVGSLPLAGRIAAGVSLLLLGVMAHVVLARAGLARPVGPAALTWPIWVVFAISVLSATMNLLTPSAAERMIWGPVTLVMLACVLRVVLSPPITDPNLTPR